MKKLYCPKCNNDLTKRTKEMEVSKGYFRACTNCDEDFYSIELKTTDTKDLYDAQHPDRQKAMAIMDFIGAYLGNESIFDCKNGGTQWYDVEDRLTEIINSK